jgi:hypothetical protein
VSRHEHFNSYELFALKRRGECEPNKRIAFFTRFEPLLTLLPVALAPLV